MRCFIPKLLLLLFICSYTHVFSQSYYQATVYFASGAYRTVSPGDTSATITSQNILNVLSSLNIDTSYVYPAFPEFNETDTLEITENGDSISQMNKAKIFVITVSDTTTLNTLVTDLKNLNEVLFAEANGISESDAVPNDTYYHAQWGLHNTTVPGADIHAEGAWDIFTGNPNSIIAIVDQGIDISQNDLSAKIIGGDNTYHIDANKHGSHGTEMAGIAAASTNNYNGIAGVDWAAKLISEDMYDYWNCFCINFIRKPHGDNLLSKKLRAAVDFSPNVWTINNSWELTYSHNGHGRYSTIVREAFAYDTKKIGFLVYLWEMQVVRI